MKTRHLSYLLALLASQILPAFGAEPIELFNGRDLSGWHTFLVDTREKDLRGVFTVTNGWLRISGDGLGYVATKQTFTNYHLSLEFRWGMRNYSWGGRIGKARDSGVFLHATGPDGNSEDGKGAWMAAIECNIFQGATGDFLLIRGKDAQGNAIHPRLTARTAAKRDADGWFTWSANGESKTIQRMGRLNWLGKDPKWRDMLDFRGENDVERTGWNALECICRDGSIEVRLNGQTVNRAEAVWPNAGRILLQCEGSEIFFRNISIR